MITDQGKRICDAEIYTRGQVWRGCRKPARVTVPSKVVPHMELDYCGRHAPKPVPHAFDRPEDWQPKRW